MKKRTKTIIAVIAGAAILIGGIWMINESRYPNVPAFDDHFTREFLNKDKKVDDGFYEFKSKTGQYTMWFPEDFAIANDDGQGYSNNEQSYEDWRALSNKKEKGENLIGQLNLKFFERSTKDEAVFVEATFKRRFHVNEPHIIETKNKKIYYDSAYTYFKGTEEKVIKNKSNYISNTYVGYVVDKHSNKTIETSYDFIGDELSKSNGEKINEDFLKMLKSIRFAGNINYE
ncbi:hypothetical protein COJ01_14580 [Priestia megaterium]|uniref:hypothetical protein n=1 Tax=Priestia TaxID=2800373 RepID=UPI000BF3C909|nr:MULTISPECIES: hypothetical protein [Priestia]MDC0704391.1 hypothetical protein [Priestia sp. AB]MED4207655.1 hypothetical protein [Priestia megaterium]PFL00618.1 hypothetical protein COJ01_14580 [Priestia megaterium]PFR94026.1 hypothetical protein COK39_15470 [Priestia megaterium]